YSAMKFSMFFIAEYSNMVTASALMVTLFFGGWDVPFTLSDNLPPYEWYWFLLSLLLFAVKVLFFLFLFMWVRWTLPRFRYDQLMSLGWKFMLPLALAYIVVIAGALLLLDMMGVRPGALHGTLLGGLNFLLVVALFYMLDRGRIISPASARLQRAELARLRAVALRRAAVPSQGD
ncbi:MAG: NADH-quinone oxidoreductase subunit H, partial [Gemmatimonadaceae bacterium]